jgi:hypothetical protein
MNWVLPDNIQSPEQIEAALLDLSRLSDWLRRKTIKEGQLDEELATRAQAILAPIEQSAWTLELVDEVSKRLESLKSTAPLVRITLPGLPSPKLRAELVGWLRREINPNILVSFSFNRLLAGGMVIRAGSKIYDFSFSGALLKQRSRLAEMIHGV